VLFRSPLFRRRLAHALGGGCRPGLWRLRRPRVGCGPGCPGPPSARLSPRGLGGGWRRGQVVAVTGPRCRRGRCFPCYSCLSGCPAKALSPGLRGVTAGLGWSVAGRSLWPGGTWNPSGVAARPGGGSGALRCLRPTAADQGGRTRCARGSAVRAPGGFGRVEALRCRRGQRVRRGGQAGSSPRAWDGSGLQPTHAGRIGAGWAQAGAWPALRTVGSDGVCTSSGPRSSSGEGARRPAWVELRSLWSAPGVLAGSRSSWLLAGVQKPNDLGLLAKHGGLVGSVNSPRGGRPVGTGRSSLG
jgi:hypothetical protein